MTKVKAASGGQARSFHAMIISSMDEKVLEKIDSKKFQEVIDNPGKFIANFTEWINNDCHLNLITNQSFVIDDIFPRAGEGYTPIHLWPSVRQTLFEPAIERRIIIAETLPGKLKSYMLDETMSNEKIQIVTKSIPMNEDEFFVALFLLVANSKLGKDLLGYEINKRKYYLFHIKLLSGKLTTFVCNWEHNEWHGRCYDYSMEVHDKATVFLFFNTVNN